MSQYIVVKDLTHLHAIQNHEPGELAYCEDTKEIYMWDEERGWEKISVNNEGFSLNLYDLNKSIINQLDPLTIDDIKEYETTIMDYYKQSDNNHHMLLCRDFNYYTIFEWTEIPPVNTFSETVIDIISELGEVFSIDKLNDGALEIWIRPHNADSSYVFYLFPYDAGVVYYG